MVLSRVNVLSVETSCWASSSYYTLMYQHGLRIIMKFFQLVDCNCEVMFLPCVFILVLLFFVINCEGHLLQSWAVAF